MQILYSDRDIAVCNKPVGLDCEADVPRALSEQLGGNVYPVHRLDKNVGGVMVYARTKSAAAAISEQIRNGQLIKEYVACVHGSPPPKGDWEDLLFRDRSKNKVFVVDRIRAGVKKARLEYVCTHPGETSLVKIRLHTGRTHQIRVQFASRGYPLVGDHKYGARDKESAPMLFSCQLTIPGESGDLIFSAYPDWYR